MPEMSEGGSAGRFRSTFGPEVMYTARQAVQIVLGGHQMTTRRNPYTATTREVSEALGVSRRSIQRWSLEGTIEAVLNEEGNAYLIHDDYLNPTSRRSQALLQPV